MARKAKQRDFEKYVAGKVSVLRSSEGITTTELSRRTGIAQGTISKIENQGYPLSWRSLYALAEYFGVSAYDIIPPASADMAAGVTHDAS